MIYLPLLIGFAVFVIIKGVGSVAIYKATKEIEPIIVPLLLGVILSAIIGGLVNYDIQDGKFDGQAVRVSK